MRLRASARDDIVRVEDGFHMYFPPKDSGGGFRSWHLRVIADYLDELDEPWEAEIERYFRGQVDNGEVDVDF